MCNTVPWIDLMRIRGILGLTLVSWGISSHSLVVSIIRYEGTCKISICYF